MHPFLQSLPVETLGPESMTGLESMMDPESDRASQALGSPSRAAAEELAGAEDGGGSGPSWRWGVATFLCAAGCPSVLGDQGFAASYLWG